MLLWDHLSCRTLLTLPSWWPLSLPWGYFLFVSELMMVGNVFVTEVAQLAWGLKSYFFPICLPSFFYLKSRGAGRDSEIFHVLVHSSNGHHGLG